MMMMRKKKKKKRKYYENLKKVKDYDYYTRKFRGPALCNSRYQDQKTYL